MFLITIIFIKEFYLGFLMAAITLETRAKELLKRMINEEGEIPKFLGDFKELSQCINYLKTKNYVFKVEGNNLKSLSSFPYVITGRGREWVGS